MLPLFSDGQAIVAEERWYGRLWSAVPQRVVTSDSEQLVTYVPAGTASVVASHRSLPGTEGLDRSRRKLLALQTKQVWPRQISETPTKLYFYRADRWSRVNLGWDPADGRFLGWYVNFERPPQPTAHGIESKDLVLDLYVNADLTWNWQDRDDFGQALNAGVIERELEAVFAEEAVQVLRELHRGLGAFDPRWQNFVPATDWPAPALPAAYGPDGEMWADALPPP